MLKLSILEAIIIMVSILGVCSPVGYVLGKQIPTLKRRLLERLWTIIKARKPSQGVQVSGAKFVKIPLLNYHDVPIKYKLVRALYFTYKLGVIWPTNLLLGFSVCIVLYTFFVLVVDLSTSAIPELSSKIIVVGFLALFVVLGLVLSIHHLFWMYIGPYKFIINNAGGYEISRVDP